MSNLLGVDVSNWQGDFDWTQASQRGWTFAAAKASEGIAFPDEQFVDNFIEMKQAGLARIAYLFFHPVLAPMTQLNLFDRMLRAGAFSVGDLIALDHETDDGLPPGKVASAAVNVAGYLRTKYRCSPLIYTYQRFAEAGNCAGLGSYPLWLADPGGSAVGVPAPWGQVSIEQYGTVPQDQDRAYFATTAQLERLAMQPEAITPVPFPGTWKVPWGTWLSPKGELVAIGVGTDNCLYQTVRQGTVWSHPERISGPVTFHT